MQLDGIIVIPPSYTSLNPLNTKSKWLENPNMFITFARESGRLFRLQCGNSVFKLMWFYLPEHHKLHVALKEDVGLRYVSQSEEIRFDIQMMESIIDVLAEEMPHLLNCPVKHLKEFADIFYNKVNRTIQYSYFDISNASKSRYYRPKMDK